MFSVSDALAPATDVWTIKKDGAVKIRMRDSGPASEKPITIPSHFQVTVQKVPNQVALGVKRQGVWKTWTWTEYYQDVVKTAKALIKLGLQPNNGVGILGFNAPEWLLSFLGAIYAGGLPVGIYTTNSPEACQYVAEHSSCNVIVVEDDRQLQKILAVWDSLPLLKAVIQYTGELKEKRANVYTWEEFMEFSKETPDSTVQSRLTLMAPNKCCSLIYTSGTTGNPKGVMLSHDNYVWSANATCADTNLPFGGSITVSYLPLSHVAAQVLDIFMPISRGVTVYFAQPDALKGSLVVTLKEVRPTYFFGVPRVWEKMQERMLEVGKTTTGLKKTIATWAKDIGLRGALANQKGEPMPWGWTVANFLVFSKVKAALGFDRCTRFASGAAPLLKQTQEYLASLNINILSTYGMSESTGPHTYDRLNDWRISSIGKEMTGVETLLYNTDDDGEGEVCMNGRHCCMGYFNDEVKTRELFDEKGWLHSGDIGKRADDGFLYITGRIKEIIITAGGENIAPVPIEERVKDALPVVSQCMVIGDKRKFLSMFITVKTEVNLDTMEPLDDLTQRALDWCKSVGSNATRVTDVLNKNDANFSEGIQAGIDKANSHAVSQAAKIQKWCILPKDFSIPGGEFGPTMKVKRPVVLKMYSKLADAFYD